MTDTTPKMKESLEFKTCWVCKLAELHGGHINCTIDNKVAGVPEGSAKLCTLFQLGPNLGLLYIQQYKGKRI